jgi:predicted nucleic acid-binding protein
MKKLRIYVDTSVIGGCLDDEFKEWSNGLLLDFQKGSFEPVLSDLLSREIARAPASVSTVFVEFLKLCPTGLVVTNDEMLDLADMYLQRNIVTPKYEDDARHIAIATVVNADIVVSWNFKHIVHFDKINRFNAVNLEMGYRTLAIHSPREVTWYGNKSC